MEIDLSVSTTIVGKQRPRFKRIGKKFMTYTPKKTQIFEDVIAEEFRKQYPAGHIPFPEEPLEMSCVPELGSVSAYNEVSCSYDR